jgi:hypothetical protein
VAQPAQKLEMMGVASTEGDGVIGLDREIDGVGALL